MLNDSILKVTAIKLLSVYRFSFKMLFRICDGINTNSTLLEIKKSQGKFSMSLFCKQILIVPIWLLILIYCTNEAVFVNRLTF